MMIASMFSFPDARVHPFFLLKKNFPDYDTINLLSIQFKSLHRNHRIFSRTFVHIIETFTKNRLPREKKIDAAGKNVLYYLAIGMLVWLSR